MSCSKSEQDITDPDDDGTKVEVSNRYFVAPVARGTGDGRSEENVADFLAANFWNDVRKKFLSESIEVQFLSGEYERAYLEGGLVFSRIGHPENKLILKCGDDVVFPLQEGEKTKSYVMNFGGA